MRNHYNWQPRATRLSVGALKEAHKGLDDDPRSLRLSLTPDDWMLSFRNQPGSVLVGLYTESITVEKLHADIELVAKEMVAELRGAAA